MKKIIIDSEFWNTFPEAQLNILVLKNLDNQVNKEEDVIYQQVLEDGKKAATSFLGEDVFSQNQVVSEWREAFKLFKTKKGARSSIEALLKRVDQDRDFNPINPLVDIYNSVSLTYAVPCGGEDLEAVVGDLHLGKAQGGEDFYPLGADTSSPALPEEIIYYDEDGAICRCFNWREAQRTMLKEETKNAILVIEAINEEQAQRADQAIIELQKRVEKYLGVTGEISKLTQEKSEVIIA